MLLTTARLVFSLTLCLSFTSAFVLSPRVVHERRSSVPRQWTPVRRAASHNVIPLRFGLKQSNIEDLEDFLMDVSHPESSNYGKHWDAAKILDTFRPSAEAVETVREWLIQSGVDVRRHRLGAGHGWLHVNVTIDEAERLLGTEYFVYAFTGDDSDVLDEHIACADKYHLPEHVSKHVDFVTPTLHFDAKMSRRREQQPRDAERHGVRPQALLKYGQPADITPDVINGTEHCDYTITPDCLRALYSYNYTHVATNNNSFGIVEYTPEAYLGQDLDNFFKNFSQELVGHRPKMYSIDGGVLQTENQSFAFNGESALDLAYSMALSGEQQVTLYQTGDLIEGASFNNFLDAVDGSYCTFEGGDVPGNDGIYPDNVPGGYNKTADCGTVKPANVISTSYTLNEADMTGPYSYRQCAEYGKLGLMGVTVLYSSGDYGVSGSDGMCLMQNGSQAAYPEANMYNPTFPGSCPYVTTVGATQITPGNTVEDPEVACHSTAISAGGVSNRFARPSYQQSAVDAHFKNYGSSYATSAYNQSNSRAYPDISSNGANYTLSVNNVTDMVSGTSASTPVWGALITAINDARIAQGKGPVGFINPTIYTTAFAEAFNDITSGNNPACGSQGFNATPGWDPVTGLGTPNFPKLLELFTQLP